MSQRVFEIDELTRLIFHHLVEIDRGSLVSIARTCRMFEEPALSSLWETKDSFSHLVHVLTVADEGVRDQASRTVPSPISLLRQTTEHSHSGNTRHRYLRYASWMRRLRLEENVLTHKGIALDRVLVAHSTSNGLLCPNLRRLDSPFTKRLRPLIPLFISPRLTHLTLHVDPSGGLTCQDLGPILQALPTPCIQELFLDFGQKSMVRFAHEISFMIQRCGDSLRLLHVPISLGEATVRHVLNLNGLQCWNSVYDVPPIIPPLSAPFPSLHSLTLYGKKAHGWMAWLTQRRRGALDGHDGPLEHSRVLTSLTDLTFVDSVPVDATFISPLHLFPNLVVLRVTRDCYEEPRCSFSLTNQDVAKLSAALPRLEVLDLGRPCAGDTTPTTISCFLAPSIHCKSLRVLSIHFNVTKLVDDVRSLSKDPDFRGLRSLPTRCTLESFSVGILPFPGGIPDEEITTIAKVLIGIFPSLLYIECNGLADWEPLSDKIEELQATHLHPS